ncbi:MAG TPA: YhbY family RNA-binding protein [Polyangia bacterium]
MTLMPASDLRRALRGHGHAMSAIVQIGKSGVTDGVIKQVEQALADHELIKVKIGGECPVDRHEVAARLDREPGVDIVQMVGRVLLLYKRHPQTPRYEGKRARAAKPGAEPPAKPRAASASRRGGAPSRSGKAPGRRPARAARR